MQQARLFLILGFCLGFIFLNAQQAYNTTLAGQWDNPNLPVYSGLVYNDIWGYAANGREYAIMGSAQRIHFLDVTDPANIDEVASFAGGTNSIWRDMKTFGHYAYAAADEGNEGLMIFDLSDLPNSVTKVYQSTEFFNRAHNLFVDEANERLYIAGISGGNLRILDLSVNPASPDLMAILSLTDGYVHDVFVENNIAYTSHPYASSLWVYDLTIPTLPNALGTVDVYDYSGLNHSSWVSGTKMVFADENHGKPLKMADISDLDNIAIRDYFQSNLLGVPNPTSPNGSIPHNPFIKGDLCIVSYYHDGVQVFDISDPTDVQRVAYYDTFTSHSTYGGYNGCWGVYPFLPSGRIIASDTYNGLHVIELDENVGNTGPLPVEWGVFAARNLENTAVGLSWNTLQEEDNKGFSVQRQNADGRFANIGFVAANEMGDYTFTDREPLNGMNIYRLEQMDFDGNTDFSSIVSVQLEKIWTEWEIYPNPATVGSTVRVRTPQTDHSDDLLYLVNADGRTVASFQLDMRVSEPSIQLPTNLPTAWYYWHSATGQVAEPIFISDNK